MGGARPHATLGAAHGGGSSGARPDDPDATSSVYFADGFAAAGFAIGFAPAAMRLATWRAPSS